MLTCPKCQAEYRDGTLVCQQDGYVFAESYKQGLAAGLMRLELPPVPVVQAEPTLEISLEHCGDQDTGQFIPIRWEFPLDEVGEPPLRIGRSDRTEQPPIIPEVDLTEHLIMYSSQLSRVQAVIERRGETLVLRTLSSSVITYHRRTGEPKARPLLSDQYIELEDYDTFYFGNPKRRHVRLRVRILRPS